MKPQGPTSWLLDGRNLWFPAATDGAQAFTLAEGVTLGATTGIRLDADPAGPLAPDAPDDSFGGLILPRRMTIDSTGRVYLLTRGDGREGAVIKRFDPETKGFVPLPAVGGRGRDPRQFRGPRALAISGSSLYVADSRNRRVQVFDLATLALVNVFGPWTQPGRPVYADADDAWHPYDLAAGPSGVAILDRRHGRVYLHRRGQDFPRLAVETGMERFWRRIAVDRNDRVVLRGVFPSNAGSSTRENIVVVYDARGDRVTPPMGLHGNRNGDAGWYGDGFDPPPIRLDDRGRFCLPASLARLCGRTGPVAPPKPERALGLCKPGSGDGLIFDRSGRPAVVAPGERPGPPPLLRAGTWISKPLDGRVFGCQWHRIELTMIDLPPGSRVTVSSFASDTRRLVDDTPWDLAGSVAGKLWPDASTTAAEPVDFLVQSREGQYLWLKIDLLGDGYATPVVGAIRVHFPRESYLGYLPGVFSFDDDSRRFLERFLSGFQTEWDRVDHTISEVAGLFDPRTVPDTLIDYLAGWLAVPMDDVGQEGCGESLLAKKRRLLEAAPEATPRRGTSASIRETLQANVENLTGLTPDQQAPYPILVEGYRMRPRLELGVEGQANLGRTAPTWGPGVVGRLRLGGFAREGEARLVSRGDPQRDVFNASAHRFRVVIPSVWVRTPETERAIRRAIEGAKPAHTEYDLCLVEPRCRVGIQSTVGIDTVLGGPVHPRLADAGDTGPGTSRPPEQRLGYDTVLAGGQSGARPGRNARVGIDTLLS